MNSYYFIMLESESGDTYGPFLFKTKPTEQLLKEVVQSTDYDPTNPGPGLFDSYVHMASQGWTSVIE